MRARSSISIELVSQLLSIQCRWKRQLVKYLEDNKHSAPTPYSAFMHEATTAPNVSYFDCIIIGGGTAGCPLAATLLRNASVLLLERGGSPFDNANITDITAFGTALMDTSSTSPSQLFISEDGVRNARGHLLGGGSSINAGFYSQAASVYVKDTGWDEKLVNESYGWVEKAIVFKPVVRQWQSAMKAGLLEAGITPDNGFTHDHLYGTKLGGTIFDENGRRHSAANLLGYASSHRLTTYLRALVHKIMFQMKDSSGKKHRAYLKKGTTNEITVSAGSLGSPQLLMLSGLAPEDQLQAHGINVVLAQPGIGNGMADNPKAAIFVLSLVSLKLSALLTPVTISRVDAVPTSSMDGAKTFHSRWEDSSLRRNWGPYRQVT